MGRNDAISLPHKILTLQWRRVSYKDGNIDLCERAAR